MSTQTTPNKVTVEAIVNELSKQDSKTVALVALGKMDIYFDPLSQKISIRDAERESHNAHLRMNIGASMAQDLLDRKPELVEQLAENLLISVQLQKDIISKRMNMVRSKLNVAPLIEADMCQIKRVEGVVISQNKDQSILAERKTGNQFLFEHSATTSKPVPNILVSMSRNSLDEPWSCKPLSLNQAQSQTMTAGIPAHTRTQPLTPMQENAIAKAQATAKAAQAAKKQDPGLSM